MKRKTAFSFLLFLTMTMCFGQNKESANTYRLPNNSIYLELVGTSLIYSLNYERIIYNVNRFYISARIGASYQKIIYYEAGLITLLLNGIVHCKKNLYFEFGTGITFLKNNNSYQRPRGNPPDYEYISASNLGIRIQKRNGFLFRAGLTPLFNFKASANGFIPIAGLSFGYSFGRKNK